MTTAGALRPVVMVVDDDAAIHEALRLVPDDTYELISAFDGAAGVDALDRQRVHLVLLDLLMPRVDGWQFFEHLRRMRAPRPKVIFLTGVDSSVAAVAALKLGAEDWILKPFDEELLRRQLEKLLRPIRRAVVYGGTLGGRSSLAVVVSTCCGVSAEYAAGPSAREASHDTLLLDGAAVDTASDLMTVLARAPIELSLGRVTAAALHHIALCFKQASVESVADALRVSSSYLLQLFRKDLGLTPRDYIARVRVEVIKQRLGQPNCPSLDRLAEEVGFCDAAHLSRVFSKYVQAPPGRYCGNMQG